MLTTRLPSPWLQCLLPLYICSGTSQHAFPVCSIFRASGIRHSRSFQNILHNTCEVSLHVVSSSTWLKDNTWLLFCRVNDNSRCQSVGCSNSLPPKPKIILLEIAERRKLKGWHRLELHVSPSTLHLKILLDFISILFGYAADLIPSPADIGLGSLWVHRCPNAISTSMDPHYNSLWICRHRRRSDGQQCSVVVSRQKPGTLWDFFHTHRSRLMFEFNTFLRLLFLILQFSFLSSSVRIHTFFTSNSCIE